MKLLGRFFTLCAACVLALAALAPARAEIKPVLIISIAGVDETIADIKYITKTAGFEGAGGTAEFFGKAYTNGVDRKRPIGVILSFPEGPQPVALSFIPVTDLKAILAMLKETPVGEPKDAGDGLLELSAGPQPVYIKEAGGWAFISQEKAHLADLPADPTALLGNLPKDYTLAVKVNLQNLPDELKKMAADQLRMGFEQALQNAPAEGDTELQEKVGKAYMENMIRLMDELAEITVGLQIDAAGQKTYLDITQTAVEGTRMAKQYAGLANTKSDYAAFLLPEAAVTFNASAPVAKEDVEQVKAMMDGLKANALKELDNDPDLDATRRAAAKELLGGFLDVFVKTMEAGKMDMGGALILEPKSLNFVAGGLVADGQKVEELLAKLADLAKDEPDAPEIKINAGKHGDIDLHTITGPIPDGEAEAKDFLGDKLNFVIGTGSKSVYAAFGKDAEGLLKRMVDQVKQGGGKAVPPSQFNVSVLPILKFAASVDDNPIVPKLVEALEKSGKDKITAVTEARPNGANTRIQVEEGVLQLIGEAAKASGLAPQEQQF